MKPVIQDGAEGRKEGEDTPVQQLQDAPTCALPTPRQGLTRLEQGELSAIFGVAVALYATLPELVWAPRFGAAVAYAAALFLGQGLIRDLIRLALEGRKKPTRTLRCMCAETTVGVVALMAGLGLLFLGIEDTVRLTPLGIALTSLGVLAAGFVAKDYVLVLRKERDHGSVRVG